MKSFLRWVGGKHLMARRIVSMLPEHQCYVETCAGGAWVFFDKSRSRCEVLNDVDGELVNLYQVLQRRGNRLFKEVDALPYSRTVYYRLFLSRPRDSMRRAVRFLYVNRVGFGGKVYERSFGVKTDGPCHVLGQTIRRDWRDLIDRMRGVILENLDVERVVDVYDRPHTLFFVDPPYAGLSQPYAQTFGQQDHERLAARLGGIKGKFLLTYNDCDLVRRLYADFHVLATSTTYTVSRNGCKRVGELIISNFRPAMSAQDAATR